MLISGWAMSNQNCILCTNKGTVPERSYRVEDLISGWENQYSIDIRSEFDDCGLMNSFICPECGLIYFSPAVSGSEQFYARLQNFDWYYLPSKWEFAVALSEIQLTDRVLEIGCGWGEFVTQAQMRGVSIKGIELNGAAVQAAQAKGLPVTQEDLDEIAKTEKGSFDVVCSFQVLEHVSDPRQFITASLELLREGGRLIISVPNNDTFIRYDPNGFLNMPPHHITRWSKRPFEYLQSLFPLKLLHFAYEPLAEYHVGWYASVQQYRLSKLGRMGEFASIAFGVLFKNIVIASGLYRSIRGHSIYACFTKIS